MTRKIGTAMLVLALLAALPLAGCGSRESAQDEAAAKMVERAARAQGEEVDVEIDSRGGTFRATTKEGTFEMTVDGGTFQATGEDGTVEYSADGGTRLPDGFPADVPVFEGLNLIMSQGSSTDQEYLVMGQTGQPVAEVARFYKETLAGQGWTAGDTQQMNMGGMQMENLTFSKGERELTVSIVRQDELTRVTLAVRQ